MRVITWNCKGALDRKVGHLLELDPDIAVMQECARDFAAPSGYKFLWTGSYASKGLGVLTRDIEARIEPQPDPAWTLFLPVVLPRLNIKLLAVWAFHHRAAKQDASLTGFISDVLDTLDPWLASGRSIMAGDFNNNLQWDKTRSKHNFQHNAEKPYHIDYCFLHHSLQFSAVDVLLHEPWPKLSDHLPIVVDLDDA
jgi:exonuclease III